MDIHKVAKKLEILYWIGILLFIIGLVMSCISLIVIAYIIMIPIAFIFLADVTQHIIRSLRNK